MMGQRDEVFRCWLAPPRVCLTGRAGSVRTQEPAIPLWFLVRLSSTHVIELHRGCVAGSWWEEEHTRIGCRCHEQGPRLLCQTAALITPNVNLQLAIFTLTLF